jgi:hypothetical protein
MCSNIKTNMARNTHNELGRYAFFRQQGIDPDPNSIDDGSIAMHFDETLHDHTDPGVVKHAELVQMNSEIRIVDEGTVLGGMRRIRNRQVPEIDLADEWMQEHGHSW